MKPGSLRHLEEQKKDVLLKLRNMREGSCEFKVMGSRFARLSYRITATKRLLGSKQ